MLNQNSTLTNGASSDEIQISIGTFNLRPRIFKTIKLLGNWELPFQIYWGALPKDSVQRALMQSKSHSFYRVLVSLKECLF